MRDRPRRRTLFGAGFLGRLIFACLGEGLLDSLQSFVNEVKAQRGKKIDAAYADRLIAVGNAVVVSLLKQLV